MVLPVMSTYSDLPRVGRASALVRDLRRLLRTASERRRRGLAVLEGPHLARESLNASWAIRQVLVSPCLARGSDGRRLVDEMIELHHPVHRTDDQILSSLSHLESHQGILVILDRPRWIMSDLLKGPRPPLILVAAGIQDPGNLGALARVADAAWASGLISIGGADPWSSRSIRASAGSLLRLPVLDSTRHQPIIRSLRNSGLRLVGAVPRDGESYREADLGGGLALFMGSEGAGLPGAVLKEMDLRVTISLRRGVESLNVAAAAAVLLFQRARPTG
jgi:TrmH family RNA methyltransferase